MEKVHCQLQLLISSGFGIEKIIWDQTLSSWPLSIHSTLWGLCLTQQHRPLKKCRLYLPRAALVALPIAILLPSSTTGVSPGYVPDFI
jgi:hypothetical protein